MNRILPGGKGRRGAQNFRNCSLKTTHIKVRDSGSSLRVGAYLDTCPQIEDSSHEPISISGTASKASIVTSSPEKVAQKAQKSLERLCGATICSDCVYVGMETPVQVSSYRTEVADTQRAALLSQVELARTQMALEEVQRATETS